MVATTSSSAGEKRSTFSCTTAIRWRNSGEAFQACTSSMLSQRPKLTYCPGSFVSRASRSVPAPGIWLAQRANSCHAAINASARPVFGVQVPVV
jgi:hypothetical protein